MFGLYPNKILQTIAETLNVDIQVQTVHCQLMVDKGNFWQATIMPRKLHGDSGYLQSFQMCLVMPLHI